MLDLVDPSPDLPSGTTFTMARLIVLLLCLTLPLFARSIPFGPKPPHKVADYHGNLGKPIVFGDINIMQLTDVHSWLSGHVHETAKIKADYGDLMSFFQHMRDTAEQEGKDLWLFNRLVQILTHIKKEPKLPRSFEQWYSVNPLDKFPPAQRQIVYELGGGFVFSKVRGKSWAHTVAFRDNRASPAASEEWCCQIICAILFVREEQQGKNASPASSALKDHRPKK